MFGLRRRLRSALDTLHHRRTLLGLSVLSTKERVGVAYTPQIDMCHEETLLLYTLTRGLRPLRILEIGAFRGGSGMIFANALEDVGGPGRIVGLDPAPQFEPDHRFHGRYELVRGSSPDDVPKAVERLGGSVDLALIDGLHTHDAVASDLRAVFPFMNDDSHILHHDAFHYGISQAADEFCREHPKDVFDAGLLTRTPTLGADPWVAYGGLRLLRIKPFGSKQQIERGYRDNARATPKLDDDIINHDGWYCANFTPCARCRAEAERRG